MPSHALQLVCVCVCVINNCDFTSNIDDLSSSGEEDDRSLGQLAASDVLSKLIDLVWYLRDFYINTMFSTILLRIS